ncbi:hypothetical protein BT96DRAFT_912422 [Gymnopus androsaceus JB14]|uniref:Uncharacterized protein n=1 Tax=Gymnopus androsaceus JB14 TaxID=1447944 RepID=A0A6A4IKV7_9AGAR|nr:hypothetical protein BT96DRAFT_912422 [Gymnopus androsaceus JB14]
MVGSLILMSLLVLGHPVAHRTSATVVKRTARLLFPLGRCGLEERKDAVPGPHLALMAPSPRG